MADQTERIILEVETNKANERLKEITALLASQAKGQRDLAAEVRKAGKATEEQATQLVAYKTNITALSKEQGGLYKILSLADKANTSAAGSYNQLSAEAILLKQKLNELEGTLQKNADGTYQLSQEYVNAKTASENANKALIEFDLGVKSGGRNVGNYADSIAGMEEKLKDLQESLRHLEPNSKAFEETKKAADDTQVSLGILTGKFDEFGNREPKNPQAAQMDAVADATSGAVSAFEVYNVIASESEGANEAQAAALRAIAIAQNLRNIQIGIANAGEAANVVVTKISALFTRQKTAATLTDTAVTTASTVATTAKTKAVGIATVATRLWNMVLRLNPIGLVVTAVLAAVAAVTFLTNKFNIAAKAGEFFNKHFQGVVKWLEKTGQALGLVDTATEKALKTMEKRKEAVGEEIRVLEAAEGKEREIYERKRQLMFDEARLLNKLHAEKGKLSDEETKRRQALLNDMKIMDIEEKQRIEDVLADRAKKAADDAKKAKDDAKKARDERDRQRKEDLDIEKLYLELELKQAAEGSMEQLRIRQELIRKQLEIDNTGADVSRARRVANEKKANAEILEINQEYFDEMEVMHREFSAKVLGPINKEDVEKQVAALGQRLEAQKQLNANIADSEEELQRTKIDAMSAGVDALKGFFGEQSEAAKAFYIVQKGFAIADIILNLQAEIAKIASANAILGPAGIPLTVAQVLAAKIRAGIGIGTIAATTIQEFSMAEGGVIEGPSHAGGGVRGTGSFANVEVEGGEAVINKASTSRYKDILSAINVAGGGKPLGINRFMQAGGLTAAPAPVSLAMRQGDSIAASEIRRLGADIRQLKIQVSVADINRVQNKVQVKQGKTDI
jgi:hypothetical protein